MILIVYLNHYFINSALPSLFVNLFCYATNNNKQLSYTLVGKCLPQPSHGGAITLTAVICSTVFFVLGTILGMLSLYFILRYKQSHANKNDQPAETQPPLPVYEDIHISPPSTADNKQVIELNENVAYKTIN